MSYGWISIHRKIQDNLIWNDKPFNRGAAWVDLLLLANHEDKKVLFNGSIINVKRGEKNYVTQKAIRALGLVKRKN